MSLEVYVFLDRELLPTARQWASAIRNEGFDVDLDSDFDTNSHTGFLQCPDSKSGFEYIFEPLTKSTIDELNLTPEERSRLDSKNSIVSFGYKTEEDLSVVLAASFALKKISNGILFDAETGAIVETQNALDWAKGEYFPTPDDSHPNSKSAHKKRMLRDVHWSTWLKAFVLLASSIYFILKVGLE